MYSSQCCVADEIGHVVGHVVRWEDGEARRRAFLWGGLADTPMGELGLLPSGTESAAEDINDGGFIAGVANESVRLLPSTKSIMRNRAFLYHSDFGMYGLPVPWFTGSRNCEAVALGEVASATVRFLAGTCDSNDGPRAVRWDVTLRRISTTPPGPTP